MTPYYLATLGSICIYLHQLIVLKTRELANTSLSIN